MINLDYNSVEKEVGDFHKKGFYFQSNCRHYLIEVDIKEPGTNCLVTIHEIGIPQNKEGELIIPNGEEIATSDNTDYLCEIDLWGKYYFPKFASDQYQWYYNTRGNEDQIMAMAEVMKFALELGLKKANITLY